MPGLLGGEASFVVHMLPLRRSVHDILVMATLVESARTYLKRVFQKPAPHQQGQLVTMLKTQPWVPLPAR